MKDYDKRIPDLQISMLQKSQWDWVIRRSIEPVSRQFRCDVGSKSHVSMLTFRGLTHFKYQESGGVITARSALEAHA